MLCICEYAIFTTLRYNSVSPSKLYLMKILLVEDERKIARAIATGFTQERMILEICHDGPSGLATAKADEFDVIILDRMLPGNMDGVDICRELRSSGIKTPILLLTAKGTITNRVEGLNAGADDYLVKPFAFDELLARVHALTRRPHDTVMPVLKTGDLVLDPLSLTVKRAGKPIQLSQTEYRLLEYLMRNQDHVLSKTTIMNHVWDFDADILPNTVEAYIGYLRTKIDRPFAKQLIHTVRGFGYKIGVTP